MMATSSTSTTPTGKERYLLPPSSNFGGGGGHGGGQYGSPSGGTSGGPPSLTDLTFPQEWSECQQKSRRRSTIHSYAISSVLHTLPNDAHTLRQVRHMTEAKAMKNIFALSLAFMLVFTGFVSLQSLQSTLHAEGGLGVVSLSIVYGGTVLSCLLAPWLINRLTTKWTIVLAFSLYVAYFAANFFPNHYLLIPLSVLLGALTGPMWSAQATYVTTLAMTFAQHRKLSESSDETINKFMGIFFGFFRSSQIWGNLVSALVLSKNDSNTATSVAMSSMSSGEEYSHEYILLQRGQEMAVTNGSLNGAGATWGSTFVQEDDDDSSPHLFSSSLLLMGARGGGGGAMMNASDKVCGVGTCLLDPTATDGIYRNLELLGEGLSSQVLVPQSTKYLLLSACLGCGLMGIVIVVALVDQIKVGKRNADPEFSMTSFELFMWTLKMAKDSKCCLLMPLVVFIGLEQGFMFSDFTKSYVGCTLGFQNIGPLLICFGASSAATSIAVGYVSRHIKRLAFVAAGAAFNAGLLVVLALWRPTPHDVPNFYVVAGCLGLCDAIWQTQTYTLFGVLFSHKQEAAFASYRMFHATGCAVAFGYSHFLCVETKVYILCAMLALALALYTVIEMKMQLQSQYIQDIVAL